MPGSAGLTVRTWSRLHSSSAPASRASPAPIVASARRPPAPTAARAVRRPAKKHRAEPKREAAQPPQRGAIQPVMHARTRRAGTDQRSTAQPAHRRPTRPATPETATGKDRITERAADTTAQSSPPAKPAQAGEHAYKAIRIG